MIKQRKQLLSVLKDEELKAGLAKEIAQRETLNVKEDEDATIRTSSMLGQIAIDKLVAEVELDKKWLNQLFGQTLDIADPSVAGWVASARAQLDVLRAKVQDIDNVILHYYTLPTK